MSFVGSARSSAGHGYQGSAGQLDSEFWRSLPMICRKQQILGFLLCSLVFTPSRGQSILSNETVERLHPALTEMNSLKGKLSGKVAIKIVGGHPVRIEDNPWQVLLLLNGGRFFCGGSIIDTYWILTAAHCAIAANSDPINISVVYGTSKFSSGGLQAAVEKLFVHPNLKAIDQNGDYDYDFALLKLKDKMEIRGQPIALPEAGTLVSEGDLVTVTGWGAISNNSGHSDDLLGVTLPVVSNITCQSSFAKQPNYANTPISNAMLCAGLSQGGMDSCSGDSGGPLSIVTSGSRTLVGVVSWGPDLCAQPGQYGVYARVSEALDWIKATLNK
jgi:secreted trypsin-like serine protease